VIFLAEVFVCFLDFAIGSILPEAEELQCTVSVIMIKVGTGNVVGGRKANIRGFTNLVVVLSAEDEQGQTSD
jgi:hypothetical protein